MTSDPTRSELASIGRALVAARQWAALAERLLRQHPPPPGTVEVERRRAVMEQIAVSAAERLASADPLPDSAVGDAIVLEGLDEAIRNRPASSGQEALPL